jgi:tetratricopeptide (TPR) repeat protein
MAHVKYRAFISYSHADSKLAARLHRDLEEFRVPAKLKRSSEPNSGRLGVFFRDRDELKASADLWGNIAQALDRSEYLIVICSADAAQSYWVNREITYFASKRGAHRILCVISDRTHENSLDTCLPVAMRQVLPFGVEPLAVDLRKGGDGRRLGRLKIVATLLDLELDQLVRRDARRRLRTMTLAAIAATIVALAAIILSLVAVRARAEAQRQRTEAEDLVTFMLGDLRKKLEPVGRLDLLDEVGARVITHYRHEEAGALDDAALGRHAQALTLIGTVRNDRGDIAGAMQAFGMASTVTARLLERSPRAGDRVFDHAQNEYWLAYGAWRLGHIGAAERGFRRYAELADRLVAVDPTKAAWRLEPAYAASNLGTLFYENARLPEALRSFAAALAIFRNEYRRAPDDAGRLSDLVSTRGWLADTFNRLGDVRRSYGERRSSAALLHARSQADLADKTLLAQSLAAQVALARRELDIGDVGGGLRRALAARRGLQALVRYDRSNMKWLEYAITADLDVADLAFWSGDRSTAQAALATARPALKMLIRKSGAIDRWRAELSGRWLSEAMMLDAAAGRRDAVIRRSADLVSALQPRNARDAQDDLRMTLVAGAYAARDQWPQVTALLGPHAEMLGPAGRDLLARGLAHSGQDAQAQGLVTALVERGYAHPGFSAYWQRRATIRRQQGG